MPVYDLTLILSEETPVFPGEKKPRIEPGAQIEKDGYNTLRYEFGTHFGTHIDAPLHMLAGGKTLSDYPAEKFTGEAIILDARGQTSISPALDRVKKGDMVLFYTGNITRLQEPDYFSNYPVIAPSIAQEMVERGVSIVGLDSFTPDGPPYDLHRLFLGNDVLIVENLVIPEVLIGQRVQIFIGPLPIKGADGAPCRVLAVSK
jgi:kynurenine formamidase